MDNLSKSGEEESMSPLKLVAHFSSEYKYTRLSTFTTTGHYEYDFQISPDPRTLDSRTPGCLPTEEETLRNSKFEKNNDNLIKKSKISLAVSQVGYYVM